MKQSKNKDNNKNVVRKNANRVPESMESVARKAMKADKGIQRIRQVLDTYVPGLDTLVSKTIIVDAGKLSSNPVQYIEKNIFQYTVAITLWLSMTRDVFSDLTLQADLRDALSNRGLAEVVNVVKSTFSDVLHDNCAAPEWKWLTYPASFLANKITPQLTTWFRFLSRFSPVKADKLNREAEKAFYSFNDAMEQEPFKRKGQYILSVMALGPISSIGDFHFDLNKFMWSDGTCNDGSTVVEKLRSFAHFSPHLGHPMYPLTHGAQRTWVNNAVTPMGVPKNLKVPRIIAPTSSYVGAQSHQLRLFLTDELARITGIDLSNAQDINKEWAMVYSCDKFAHPLGGRKVSFDIATVDESRASDSIPWYAYTRIFPSTIVRAMGRVREHMFYNKHTWTYSQMAFASGNPSTFVSETWFFYTCAETACWYCAYFSEYKSVRTKESLYRLYLLAIRVYGDDVELPSPVYDTYCDILEAFGIVVNQEKSYTHGSFRESCGGEYVEGVSVDSHYWPRKEVESESVTKAAFLLTSLHNHLFNDASFRETHRVLKSIIMRLYPRMTTQIGFEFSDLHDDCLKMETRLAPVGRFTTSQEILEKEIQVVVAPKGMNPDWLSTPTKRVTKKVVEKGPKIRSLTTGLRALELGEEQPSEYMLRDVHAVLSTVYGEYIPDNDVEMLLYVDFLQNGPYYKDALDELLGVSTPRLTRRTLTDKGREVVKRVTC